MLQIKNIFKTYKTGDLIQKALNGVSLNLRDNEFVAILGPSGSGKTTLLNIIGGLDKYDDGDLIINNISTKNYKDRDWDAYRNHTIGFVFQSYNLIPHQTVLSNVELALTISGISSKERKKRALDALEAVGLREQAHKKPNQMSGGQMQRVAIARALVNNPSIVLADEPTGALDTKTSVQVMELLKEVAKDRLVVMVTHNPELANEYANRIVNLKDGEIIGDSNPYILKEEEVVPPVKKKMGKAKMGFFTALTLSFNNLLTKKGRTILTAFAGSIGIIGIALILALSTGFQNYINDIQEETMSSYPLTIQKETSNVFSALLSARIEGNKDIEEGKVKEQMMISSMMNSVGSNDLTSFKKWLEDNEDLYKKDMKKITYSYSVSPKIFTKDVTGEYVQLNSNTIMSSIYSDSVMSMMSSFSANTSIGSFSSYDFDKLPDNTELLIGEYPKNYDEVIIVLSEKGKISDLLVYSLGLRDNKELKTLIADVMAGEESSIKNEPLIFSYEDLMNIDLKLIDVTDLYRYNSKYDTYENMVDDKDYMKDVFEKSETLKITGIAVSNEDSTIAGVLYSKDLVEHVIDIARNSPIVRKQLDNKDIDVFSGRRFDEKEEKAGLDFNDLVTVDEEMLKSAFKVNGDLGSIGDQEAMLESVTKRSKEASKLISDTTAQMAYGLGETYKGMALPIVSSSFDMAFASMPKETLTKLPVGGPVLDEETGKPIKELIDYPNEFLYINTGLSNLKGIISSADLPDEAKDLIDKYIVLLPDVLFLDNLETILQSIGIDQNVITTITNILRQYDLNNDDSYPIAKACNEYAVYAPVDILASTIKKATTADEIIDPIVENFNKMTEASPDTEGAVKFTIEKDTLKAVIDSTVDEYAESLKTLSDSVDGQVFIAKHNIDGTTEEKEFPIKLEDDSLLINVAGNKALSDNSSQIFKEAYDLVSPMTPLLVMSGVGNAIGDVMTPISELFTSEEGFMNVDTNAFAKAFNFDMDESEVSRLMTSMMTGSSASYSNNLINLGFQDEDDPTSISLFFNDFDSKEHFLELLNDYNENVDDEEKKIQYTDITGMLISSVQTIVNAVTYALIAFVSISLIVSSIMIAVITLISVMERTKEIGILRAMGASKKNVSSIFNAETFIIGLLSGALGVGVSWLLIFPINSIIHKATEIETLNAVLYLEPAIALIIISVVLTMVAGFIPSKKAAKQDPVIALRSE